MTSEAFLLQIVRKNPKIFQILLQKVFILGINSVHMHANAFFVWREINKLHFERLLEDLGVFIATL